MSWIYTIVFVGMMFSNSADDRQASFVQPNMGPLPVVRSTPPAETDRVEGSYPLNANGRVCVSNRNGSIQVIAWDKNEVKLVAVKRAETKEQLNEVEIKIDARPDSFSVESDYGDDRNGKVDSDRKWRDTDKVVVEYELSVPRGAMLNEIETVNGSVTLADFTNLVKVSTVNGTVRAANLRGTADLSTVNGEVAADFDKLAPGSRIALETVNGRVNLTIPSDSSATLKAESLNGVITNEFGLPSRRGKYVGNSMHGRLGTGEVAIKLESVNGPLTVKRKNDGRTLSPATNLLPAKDEDDDGDVDIDIDAANVAKISRDVERNVREAQRKASLEAKAEVENIKVKVPKIKNETLKEIDKSINSKSVEDSIKDSIDSQRAVLADMRDAAFFAGIPRVETKGNTFPVKGIPRVTIDAKGCAVRVRGWENAEVKYSVSRVRGGTAKGVPTVVENKNENSIAVKVTGSTTPEPGSVFGNSPSTRIDVFVPHKANLKIISDEEIRLDGVSGELEIVGRDEAVDIRDSDGKLKVSNVDGRVRVIGFNGEVTAQTVDGDVYVEGSISRLNAKASSGTVMVTLPPDANVDVNSDIEPESDGFSLTERGTRSWRLGNGGANLSFNSEDGKLVIRNSAVLSK
jgi:DUF4097 and DUF4098 domain-containing protein YvlB